jgi:sugar/nucleoside kinase (ribokinase family)
MHDPEPEVSLVHHRLSVGGSLPRVLVVGSACLTVLVHPYPVPGHELPGGVHVHTTVGCMGPGKALNLRRLGFPTTLHTVLGADQPGTRVGDLLAREGLTVFQDLDPAGTNTHVNLMDRQGGRRGFPIITPSRELAVDRARLAANVHAADLVVLNPNDICRQAIPAIVRHGKPVWADLGDFEPGNPYFDEFRAVADVVTMSGIHVPDQESLLAELIAEGKQLAVVTNGGDGSLAQDASGRVLHTPALHHYPMVDTNGAGDSFHAGLLYAMATGRPTAEALQVATVVAGLTVASLDLFHPDLSPARVEQEVRTHFPAPPR